MISLDYVIEVIGLEKIYKVFGKFLEMWVLKGIDLKIKCGLIFGLFGLNGVGKLIFINIFVGLVIKIVGIVKIWGFDVDWYLCLLCVVIGVVN